jgi:hypothetical protein
LGAPDVTQQEIACFCAAVKLAPLGILPDSTELLIALAAALIWAKLVKAPGPFVLPEL